MAVGADGARAGFEDACEEVRRLWLDKKREQAILAVPDEMVHQTTLIGDEAHVRARLRKYRDVGISELTLHPLGSDPALQLDTLGRAVELVREEGS